MKYHAIAHRAGAGAASEGRVVELEVTQREGRYHVVIDGRILDVDVVHLKGSSLSLLAGTRSARCDVHPGKDGKLVVTIGETAHELELLDERRLRMRKA